MNRFTMLVLILTAMSAGNAQAADVSLSHLDSGWYTDKGEHDSDNSNYLTGAYDGRIYRSFFVFDLGSVGDIITGAELRLFNPGNGYQSPDPSETLLLFNVSSLIDDLVAAHEDDSPEGMAIYEDLGTGVELGSQIVSAADNGQYVSLVLNAAAIAELNAARSGLWAIGGSLTSLRTPLSDQENVFSFSNEFDPGLLVLQTVPIPEPSTWALALLGIVGLMTLRSKRQRTR
jgi:hypothetical protein